jgi:O-antigen ligase/polysaccharide polymerase Wzy-like membrane protein
MFFLRRSARWVFFCALAVAPWYYGGTTATSINLVNWLLVAVFLLWIAELVVDRRWPRFPKSLLFIVLGIGVIGGWMVLNASTIYDLEFGAFAPLRNILPRGPGSVDYALSAAWMIRGILLLVTILFVVDLTQTNRAVLQLWYAIGIVAGSICLLGLLQKATGAEMIFWQARPIAPEVLKTIYPFFATYFYHANAGAYLNLVLPLTTGLALRTFVAPSSAAMRALWITVFALNLAAVAANTSRGAQAVAGLVLIGLIIRLGPTLVRRMSRAEMNVTLAGAAAILFLLFALAQASHLERSSERWQRLSEQMSNNARLEIARVATEMLPHVGPLGFGPGVFRLVFPYFNAQSPHRVSGFWRFLHEDYLQTIIEWGWVGAAFWGALFFGGLAVAVRALRKQRKLRRAERAANAERPTPNSESIREQAAQRPMAESEIRDQPDNRELITTNSPTAWSPRRRLILPLTVIALVGVGMHAIADFPLQIYSIQLYVATYLGICWGSGVWDAAKR